MFLYYNNNSSIENYFFRMEPSQWGPQFWYMLHIITMTYPTEPTEYIKRAYHDFFRNIKDVLPCSICQKHYSKFITEYPITPHLDSRENIVKWLIQIHNFVNLELNKPVLSVEEVIAIYKDVKPCNPFSTLDMSAYIKSSSDKKKQENEKYIYILLFICIGIIGVMKFYYTRNYYEF